MLAALSSALQNVLILIGTAYLIAVIALLAILCISILLMWSMLRQFFSFRGPLVVRCPETNEIAIIHVDAAHAAVTSIVDDPHLRLTACSRWPERQNCDRACLSRIGTPA